MCRNACKHAVANRDDATPVRFLCNFYTAINFSLSNGNFINNDINCYYDRDVMQILVATTFVVLCFLAEMH